MCALYMKYMLAIQALVQDLGLELTSSQCKINMGSSLWSPHCKSAVLFGEPKKGPKI